MADSDTAIILVESCGCVTMAIARPAEQQLSKVEARRQAERITECVWNGGEIRRTTVGEAKADPNFLPFECPHDPKGWTAEPDTREAA